jgi:putative ABC transport system substrate-binding protein
VITVPDAMLVALGGRIAKLCLDRRIAVLGGSREQTDAGGLLSYGASIDALIRRSAYYVKRILSGAQPRDLPVEQPVKFDLVINLATAKALGIILPPAMLATADETIE